MRASTFQGNGTVGRDPPRLLVLDLAEGTSDSSAIAMALESSGYHVVPAGSGGEALEVLRGTRPALAVVAEGGVGSSGRIAEIRATARTAGIPLLEVLEADTDLEARLASLETVNDWVVRGCAPEELAARVARLLHPSPPFDVPFASLVVHDLRTPLNVIGLSMRMIEQALPRNDPEVEEDLRFVEENLRQIERMLSQLSDHARLFDRGLTLTVHAFDPRRLVDEILENRASLAARRGWKGSPVQLAVEDTCPKEVTLDQGRARVAIEYALINATAAANDQPIRLTLRGGPHAQRWIIETAIDRPPPASVTSIELHPYGFERLCGCAADRRGMDLAIAARISEIFGGSARLEVVAGRGTTIILDWPAQLVGSSSPPGA